VRGRECLAPAIELHSRRVVIRRGRPVEDSARLPNITFTAYARGLISKQLISSSLHSGPQMQMCKCGRLKRNGSIRSSILVAPKSALPICAHIPRPGGPSGNTCDRDPVLAPAPFVAALWMLHGSFVLLHAGSKQPHATQTPRSNPPRRQSPSSFDPGAFPNWGGCVAPSMLIEARVARTSCEGILARSICLPSSRHSLLSMTRSHRRGPLACPAVRR